MMILSDLDNLSKYFCFISRNVAFSGLSISVLDLIPNTFLRVNLYQLMSVIKVDKDKLP